MMERTKIENASRGSNASKRTAQKRILAALQHEMPPVPTGRKYLLGLTAVAGIMLLLPVLYFGLMALIGHTVYWVLVHNVTLLHNGLLAAVLGYFGPPVVGMIILLFMIKPFLHEVWKKPHRNGWIENPSHSFLTMSKRSVKRSGLHVLLKSVSIAP
ncbi:MAG: hypothetical protein FJ267_15945 [Planctomycetes bacterium]|nr:hypothetical protein [Planctomycetota bacterium]